MYPQPTYDHDDDHDHDIDNNKDDDDNDADDVELTYSWLSRGRVVSTSLQAAKLKLGTIIVLTVVMSVDMVIGMTVVIMTAILLNRNKTKSAAC